MAEDVASTRCLFHFVAWKTELTAFVAVRPDKKELDRSAVYPPQSIDDNLKLGESAAGAEKGDCVRGKFLGVCVVLSLPIGCATPPERIKAADIPKAAYSEKSCSKLIAERAEIQANLSRLESKQNQAVAGDAVGVFLIGVPVSSLSGADRETEIAVEKGKLQAIDDTIKAKGC